MEPVTRKNVDHTLKQIRIKSLSADSVFCTSSGKSKPAKHSKLGLALKSLTSSKKVTDICNRYGHSASYHTTAELENEIALECATHTEETAFVQGVVHATN